MFPTRPPADPVFRRPFRRGAQGRDRSRKSGVQAIGDPHRSGPLGVRERGQVHAQRGHRPEGKGYMKGKLENDFRPLHLRWAPLRLGEADSYAVAVRRKPVSEGSRGSTPTPRPPSLLSFPLPHGPLRLRARGRVGRGPWDPKDTLRVRRRL